MSRKPNDARYAIATQKTLSSFRSVDSVLHSVVPVLIMWASCTVIFMQPSFDKGYATFAVRLRKQLVALSNSKGSFESGQTSKVKRYALFFSIAF